MNLKTIKNNLPYIVLLVLLVAFVIFAANRFVGREITKKEYQDINRLKVNAKKSLTILESENKKIVSFEIYNNGYFSFPLEHEVNVNKTQLNEFLNLIRISMKDDKINQKEFGSIGAFLRELVDMENAKKINSIKENLAK